MSYKFYLGNSGSGKSYRIKQDVINESLNNPDKKYIFIVPDQYTMQEQVDLVKMHKNHGIMNIDVLSFGRLTHRIFEEVGHEDKIIMDDTGKNLILRQVSLQLQDELPCIGSSLNKQGFIHQVKSVLSEFMQYGIDVEDVDRLKEKASDRQALCHKLDDLQKLYKGFLQYKEENMITTEETLSLLASSIYESELLKDSVVIFDGFTGFTPLQYQVVTSIMKCSSEVWFSICDERSSGDTENNLFALSKKTMFAINKIAKQENIKHLFDVYMDTEGIRFSSNEIKHLEKNIFRKQMAVYDQDIQDISIFCALNPREELKRICIKIRDLIKEKGYAYKDIVVVTGSLERYAPYAQEIFDAYKIPVFVDQNRKMTMNPFIEYVKSGLNVIKNDFSYESVMHMLRSGMTDLSYDEIDKLDNYLIALKIRGSKKYQKEFVRNPGYLKVIKDGKKTVTESTVECMKEINNIRQRFMDIMNPLLELIKGKHACKEIVQSLYEYIKNDNVYEKLQDYSEMFENSGDRIRKKEYDQIYQAFMKLLEQIVALVGNEEMELSDFIAILEAGISEIKIGVLPGEIDYVLLGDIERSRLGSIKALFFAGVNDGVIPKSNGTGGLISDIDREYLISKEEELAPSPRQQMFNQRLYLYMNMTKPSEKLFMSFSKTDEGGKAIRPAYLIEMLKKLFGKLEIDDYSKEVIDIKEIWGERPAKGLFSDLIRQYSSGALKETDKELLCNLYDALRNMDNVDSFVEAAFYSYTSDPLTKQIIQGLYGSVLKNSVSKLERYAACAFSHFLRYGLELEEREKFDTSNLDTGNIYHQVLQTFSDMLKDKGLKWEELSESELEKYLDEAFEMVVPEYKESIFFQDARNMYLLEKMKRILYRTVKTLGYQIKKTSFVPKRFEMGFSHVIDASNLRLGLSEDEKMLINGIIDRVDTCEEGDTIYVKVVDYKSSSKDINLVEFYNGLSLQLVIYLDQAVKKIKDKNPDKNVEPAAMYYYAVQDPVIDSNEVLTKEEIEAKIIENLRFSGLTVEDENIINKAGGDFQEKSDVINVLRVQKGYSTYSDLIKADDLKLMMDYGNYMLDNLGKSILNGDIKAAPCKDACTYCNYKDVCNFDLNIDGYEEKEYTKFKASEVFGKIKEKLDTLKTEAGE